jgi:hypothetical protein
MSNEPVPIEYAAAPPKRRRPRWSSTITSAVVGGVVGFILTTAVTIAAQVYGRGYVSQDVILGSLMPYMAAVQALSGTRASIVLIVLGVGQGPAYGGVIAAGIDRGVGLKACAVLAAAHAAAVGGYFVLGRLQ